jgi:C-terminal processing protease CtpA/Prc
VRNNDGGDDFVSRMITSRFIDQSLHVYSKQARLNDSRTPLQQVSIEPQGSIQFLGPVAVMTSAVDNAKWARPSKRHLKVRSNAG